MKEKPYLRMIGAKHLLFKPYFGTGKLNIVKELKSHCFI